VTIENSARRKVTLALVPDPDVVIRETVNGQSVYKAAIEIKGGMDYANIHNRAGQAEKSHQKALAKGATGYWTVISLVGDDMDRPRQGPPHTHGNGLT
jgi:predicted CoA-binding protein